MKNKTLIICPTKDRFFKCFEMVKTFNRTIRGLTHLILAIDQNEEEIYSRFKSDYLVTDYVCFENKTTTQMINDIFIRNRFKYDFFGVTNDDVEYKTMEWDIKLTEAAGDWGIAYGNDMYLKENMPTFSVISANIVNTLGWLQLPTLTCLYGDCVWKVIGKGINRLKYKKEIIIEHNHFLAKKSHKDSTYQRTNSCEMYKKDDEAFRVWVKQESYNDIAKLRLAMSS